MSFPLSSVTTDSLSSLAKTFELTYVNSNRGFTETSGASAFNNIPIILFDVLCDIKDISMNNDTLLFLTNNVTLSSTLNTQVDASGTSIGGNGLSVFNRYFYGSNNYDNDYNIEVSESKNVKNNNLIVNAFKDNTKYSIVPLKSVYGINDEYDYNKAKFTIPSRSYDSIYYGNNQENGYTNIYLQYSANNIPVIFDSDSYTTCYLSKDIKSFSPDSGGFTYNGSHAGNIPINSDIILLDRENYGNFTNHGFARSPINGTPLCLWLSAETTNSDANMRWMERWYDPNLVSQGQAFITAVNNNSAFSPIIDIPSTAILRGMNKFSYLRFGSKRNNSFVNSISSNLLFQFNKWDNNFSDNITGIKGFIIGDYPAGGFDTLNMNGKIHAHIPPTDVFFSNGNMTFDAWIYQDSWGCGVDTQYFGNFTNGEGYGLFFNTSANPELITFPTNSGDIFAFNNRGNKVFEKSINQSLGISASSISFIVTDLFGARWIYDDTNHQIYRLDTDDLLTQVIELSPSAKISKMELNSNNELFVLNSTNKTISGFDVQGNLSFGPSTTLGYNNFVIDQTDAIYLQNADFLQVDNNNNFIKALGVNLYKNNTLFYHIGKKILSLNIDSNNNIWVLFGGNEVIQLSPTGKILFQTIIDVPFKNIKTAALNFVKEIKNGCDYDAIWIVFNDNNYVIKLNDKGQIIKRIDINSVVNLRKCGEFKLNVRGDFTGFDVKRKFHNFSDSTIISSTNPAISLKINLKCGNSNITKILSTPAKNLRGWNNLAFSYEIKNRNTILKLFINGIETVRETLTGLYTINWGTKVSPFIIGGHSGKLGAINVERSLNNTDYFIGKIDDIRVYDRALDSFELRGLANNIHYTGWENMTWFMPTPKRTYMEEVQQFHINRYHGHKSNKFNIRVKNLGITDETTQALIKQSIENVIPKLIPLNTELQKVIIE